MLITVFKLEDAVYAWLKGEHYDIKKLPKHSQEIFKRITHEFEYLRELIKNMPENKLHELSDQVPELENITSKDMFIKMTAQILIDAVKGNEYARHTLELIKNTIQQ